MEGTGAGFQPSCCPQLWPSQENNSSLNPLICTRVVLHGRALCTSNKARHISSELRQQRRCRDAKRSPKKICPGKNWLLEHLLPVGIELLQGDIHGRWVLARGFGAQSSLLLSQQDEEFSNSPLL